MRFLDNDAPILGENVTADSRPASPQVKWQVCSVWSFRASCSCESQNGGVLNQ
jgi:hypothetical protein